MIYANDMEKYIKEFILEQNSEVSFNISKEGEFIVSSGDFSSTKKSIDTACEDIKYQQKIAQNRIDTKEDYDYAKENIIIVKEEEIKDKDSLLKYIQYVILNKAITSYQKNGLALLSNSFDIDLSYEKYMDETICGLLAQYENDSIYDYYSSDDFQLFCSVKEFINCNSYAELLQLRRKK